MPKDIRNLVNDYQEDGVDLSKNHQIKFQQK